MTTRLQIAGVLLAAGAGVRYGMPKVTAAQGKWLNVAVAAFDEGACDDVVVDIDTPTPSD
ncbi:glycosyltransferase family protein [Mycolicibacterium sarraceniae]|uniref:MobA-like NTP transferase domain-containing protein n=1 Tax=Mycolicibacterium sarraceniae TaxID=1534348 RepID=A0A7I7SK26_9MYCO|nr:hypothetical protein [Mycolicibacterium sarraceniae]BBY57314.1 hypothetical protein MSAR_04500 [Mycolicibacterium sarraceniae]